MSYAKEIKFVKLCAKQSNVLLNMFINVFLMPERSFADGGIFERDESV